MRICKGTILATSQALLAPTSTIESWKSLMHPVPGAGRALTFGWAAAFAPGGRSWVLV